MPAAGERACPRCQSQAAVDANYCARCGAHLAASFPSGDSAIHVLHPAAYTPRYLRERILAAGTALEGERKQVTVLFCDIVHSTALVHRLGAEDFHDLISAFFAAALPVVHRYDGTINQFLGDGFMALFGAPLAREDHVRLAVLAAIELQRTVAATARLGGLELRTGISTGMVIVGRIGDDLRMDYTAFGDTTVLASRLQAVAAPNEILVSTRVADRVGGYFELEAARTTQTKDGPLDAVRILGPGSRRSRLEHDGRVLAPFVGRDRELAQLLDAARAAARGRGVVVDVAGDPGVGKSRLLLEVRRALADAAVDESHCVSYGRAIPFHPIVELLRQSCGIGESDSGAVAIEKLRDATARAGLDVEAGLPFLRRLMGHADQDEQIEQLDPATVKSRIFEILREFWVAKSTVRPLVLVVEDLHWIDRTSEEFLATLAQSVPPLSLMLLVSYRAEYKPPWVSTPGCVQVVLGPLEDAASRAIVTAALAEAAEPALTESILARGEGNPFFLEELAQSTRQRWEADAAAVPQTVQEVLAARIDALSDEPRHVLQVAAILGRAFVLPLLQATCGQGPVDEHLAELRRLEFLFAEPEGHETRYAFKHALTQEVAYAGLLDRRRRELHSCVGRALETLYDDKNDRCEVIAHHYSRSNDMEKAAEYLILANRKAARRNAMEEAIGYFYEAMRVLESLPDTAECRRRRLRLVFDQTAEFHFLHRNQEYYDLVLKHQALAIEVDDPDLLGAFHARLGHRQWTAGQVVESRTTLEHAAQICASCGNSADSVGAQTILAWTHVLLGNYDLVPVHRDAALEYLCAAFDPTWYSFARAATILSYAWTGKWDHAKSEGDIAIAEGRARNDQAIVSMNATWVAIACIYRRDWPAAWTYTELALSEAPTIYFRAFPQAYLARLLCEQGEITRGLRILSQMEPLIEASGHRPAWAQIASVAADAYLCGGALAEAKSLLSRVSAFAQSSQLPFIDAFSSRLLGEIALAEHDGTEASWRFHHAIDVSRRVHQSNELALAIADRGRLQHRLGDFDAARESGQEALAILTRLGTLAEPERVRGDLLDVSR